MADEASEDGNAWKFGIGFVALGLCFALGMGCFSVYMSLDKSVCPMPPYYQIEGGLPHGTVTFVTNGTVMAGAEVTYSCEDGYQLLGPNTLTCEESGEWTPVGESILCFKQEMKLPDVPL